jgi:hypothetical protein
VLAWIGATGLFVGLVSVLGGPVSGDANISDYTAWLIAHGSLGCAFPPAKSIVYQTTAPLYPLLAGGLLALFRIGHSLPFPTPHALGLQCSTATSAVYQWSFHSRALTSTLRIGYVGWLALLAGVVALLRASGRGRSRWEPLAVLLIASLPPVYMCLLQYFHPQDLLAIGLALAGLAAVVRGHWVWAGTLIGLAFISQQFTLLILISLFVVVPKDQRRRFSAAAVCSIAAIAVPLVALSFGRAFTSVLIGTGDTGAANVTFHGLPLHGPALIVLLRLPPLALAAVVAWWAADRLGPAVFQPLPLVSLIATSLALRLAFEVSLWGYYFMAVAVLLALLDIISGRLRMAFIVWLLLVTLATVNGALVDNSSFISMPVWIWQAALVLSAIALAISPLMSTVTAYRTPNSE